MMTKYSIQRMFDANNSAFKLYHSNNFAEASAMMDVAVAEADLILSNSTDMWYLVKECHLKKIYGFAATVYGNNNEEEKAKKCVHIFLFFSSANTESTGKERYTANNG